MRSTASYDIGDSPDKGMQAARAALLITGLGMAAIGSPLPALHPGKSQDRLAATFSLRSPILPVAQPDAEDAIPIIFGRGRPVRVESVAIRDVPSAGKTRVSTRAG